MSKRGATLAEVMVGLLVFALFALAVLGMLSEAASLSRRDAEINQVNQLTTRYLEEAVMSARDPAGYAALTSLDLRASSDPAYLYAMDVQPLTQGNEQLGLKKVSVCLYYADPNGAIEPDSRRPNAGLALCLSSQVEAP